MRRIFLGLALLILMAGNANATVGWRISIPATSENPQAISPDVIENNTAIDLMLQDYRSGHVSITLVSTSEIDIGPGGVMLSNSGGSTRLMVANSTLTAMSSTNIDTGTISASSTYYIYAYASSTTATTFSIIYSASSTSPTGITYYARLGSFTTDSSKNFVTVSSDVSTGAIGSILSYATGTTGTSVSQPSLKIAFGQFTGGGGASSTITGLTFSSSSSYGVSTGQYSLINCEVLSKTSTSFVITNPHGDNVSGNGNCDWTAIGY